MALKLINTEEIWLRIASTHEHVVLPPGVWVVQRIPNPIEGQTARWVKLRTSEMGIIGSAEEALLGNYPDVVELIEEEESR
ncbi:MAG: hypothetical protein A3J55_00310 [Candidatus Ryanbacteria bacterium RIFCSPHIGHO2_02_FULL_45_17b]|uniref:Uncharacterized protein n=1 Tax=Candidatus Ryanbacteria bacterium RIFCSPHIGHO2_01_FULL_45_22 TaxID=1802114 RepID=A0A1G2G0J5_9BACT|nr:MAG: hypothetical protein A2719_02775 [Candidatus Ryanbacteria bacterium RIFCSPHIGHO2_01_FULL_45_22]OGZ46989.1 MAG: hypothetical protein A3J55_00310 [Candidatus Ryanbacteria bacterium RIFCSPHIGHO2_02_FULL_45_17b]